MKKFVLIVLGLGSGSLGTGVYPRFAEALVALHKIDSVIAGLLQREPYPCPRYREVGRSNRE